MSSNRSYVSKVKSIYDCCKAIFHKSDELRNRRTSHNTHLVKYLAWFTRGTAKSWNIFVVFVQCRRYFAINSIISPVNFPNCIWLVFIIFKMRLSWRWTIIFWMKRAASYIFLNLALQLGDEESQFLNPNSARHSNMEWEPHVWSLVDWSALY